MFLRCIVVWSLALGLVAVPRADAAESGGVSSPLMSGVGSRQLAMGRSGSALTTGAEALFWNAGRVGFLDRADLSLFHGDAFVDDARLQSVFLGYPTLDIGVFAVGLQRLGVGGIDARDVRNVPLGEITSTETHAWLGYGRSFTDRLAGGASIRVIQQGVGDDEDTAFGLDLGVAAEGALKGSEHHRWALGVQLQNVVAPKLQLDQVEVEDPLAARFGLGYRGETASRNLDWALATDFELPERGPARVGAGLELGLYEVLWLRAGLDQGAPAFGFGLGYRGIRVDYASTHDPDLPRNDQITVAASFGLGRNERLMARRQSHQREVARELESLLTQREQTQLREAQRLAREAAEAEDFTAAVRHYQSVLLVDPANAPALTGMDRAERALANAEAQTALRDGEVALAAALFQKVLDRWPDDSVALEGHRRARESLQSARNRADQLDGLFRSALAAFGDGELLDARSLLDELLRAEPDHPFGRELSERVSTAMQSQATEALKRARRARDERDFPTALRWLATAEGYAPEKHEEIASLRATWVEERDRKPEPAPARVVVPAAAPAPTRPTVVDLDALRRDFDEGLEAFGAGDFEAATTHWQRVWSADAAFENVEEYLVKAYLLQSIESYSAGDYDRALARCRRILEIDPKHEKARRYVARIEEERALVSEMRAERGR